MIGLAIPGNQQQSHTSGLSIVSSKCEFCYFHLIATECYSNNYDRWLLS